MVYFYVLNHKEDLGDPLTINSLIKLSEQKIVKKGINNFM